MKTEIPKNVIEVISKLEAAGFEAFVVGGCVRDLLLGTVHGEFAEPKDWDVTTSARPEEILKVFPDSVYENQFGTVGIKTQNSKLKTQNHNLKLKTDKDKKTKVDEGVEIVEVTTYRIESKYTDKRHPDEVRFARTLEEDLSRRDFTVNAIALSIKYPVSSIKYEDEGVALKKDDYEIIDLFGGKEDLKKKVIRAVGKADERFNEDALRMMRAIRFAVCLGAKSKKREVKRRNEKFKTVSKNKSDWEIEKRTFEAIKKNAKNLNYISKERIKDELSKIILSSEPARGIKMLDETGLLQYIIPELLQGKGLEQAHHHYYGPYREVFDHCVAALEKCPSEKLEVRLAALLHDVGKPATARGKRKDVTFYNHEYVGARIAKKILERLKFSRKVIDKVVLLVRNHMFYYNVDEVGESGVRRVVRKVGLENISDLIDVRIADRLGSGVSKAVPYKLRHFKFMVEKVSKDPISVKQLEIDGNDLMRELKLKPGPKIGAILEVLLAEVIDNPVHNNQNVLLEKAKVLKELDLEKLRAMAKERIKEEQEEREEEMKGKYWVK